MEETIIEVETEYKSFSFEGNGKEFFRIWIVNIAFVPLLAMIFLFLFSGYIYVKFKELIIPNSYYGNGKFRFLGVKEELYGIYLKISG